MLDLFMAHDLIQKRANDRFEGARVESNVRGAGQEQRPSRDTVSDLGVDCASASGWEDRC